MDFLFWIYQSLVRYLVRIKSYCITDVQRRHFAGNAPKKVVFDQLLVNWHGFTDLSVFGLAPKSAFLLGRGEGPGSGICIRLRRACEQMPESKDHQQHYESGGIFEPGL